MQLIKGSRSCTKMCKGKMLYWKLIYGMVSCLSFVLLTSSEVSVMTKSSCTDGLGLNYTLPMFNECKKKKHSNGSMVQTIPKLIPTSSADGGCPRRKSKLGIPTGHRVCRFPDCESSPCENDWCEETMHGYGCHCSAGFQGEHCQDHNNSLPVVNCPKDIVRYVDPGVSSVKVDFMNATATDNPVKASLISVNPPSGSLFQLGTSEVQYLFEDPSGNRETCNFNVTIIGIANAMNWGYPLGMESKTIPYSSLTNSSMWDGFHEPDRARLNLAKVGKLRGAWSARLNNTRQWIEVDLLTTYRILGVSTQGRQDVDQWVSSYKINCSIDGITFHTVQDTSSNPLADKVFIGNSDRNTVVHNALPVPNVCRKVRVLPITFHVWVSLRMELYGEGPISAPDWKCTSKKCYRLDAQLRTWQDALNFCRHLGPITTMAGEKNPSLLYPVTNEEFQDIVNGMELYTYVWISCNDKLNEGYVICDANGDRTGESVTSMTNWQPGEPNGGQLENCVSVDWRFYGWVDHYCDAEYHTVCQVVL